MGNVNGEWVVKEIYGWLDAREALEVAKWLDAYFEFFDKVERLKLHPAWFLDDHETWSGTYPLPVFVPEEAVDECELDHFECADGRDVRENLGDFEHLLRMRSLEKQNQECEKLMAELEGGLTTIKQ